MSDRTVKTQFEVQSYLDKLRFALDNDAEPVVVMDRVSENKKPEMYRNKYTIAALFPDEDPAVVLKQELRSLALDEYLGTVPDDKYSDRELWEFGKVYAADQEVYIKFRVELISAINTGKDMIRVISFHFAEKPFSEEYFPYKQ